MNHAMAQRAQEIAAANLITITKQVHGAQSWQTHKSLAKRTNKKERNKPRNQIKS